MKYIILLAFVINMSFKLQGQHVCGTDKYYENQKVLNPSLVKQELDWNLQTNYGKNKLTKRATKFIIPVVFHVIHLNGVDNISKAQIEDQLRVLNEDFSLKNTNKANIRAPFVGMAQDCEIEFKLAQLDPNGKCTDGINRIYSPTTVDVSQSEELVKSLPGVQWTYTRYLNIYVVNSIETSGQGIVLGYAVFPFSTNASTDGIVIRHDRVGTIGTALSTNDGGRTLTHEVGHWLGLFHTFQGGCSVNGDFCEDTPPVASTFTNASCPANSNSCTSDFPDKIDMWENYMDYSSGLCMSMFTTNQKSRMHAALNATPRNNLHTNNNLIFTGLVKSNTAPTAYFTSNTNIICANKLVQYFDNSCKANVVSRVWNFEGGTPSTSTLANPTVSYALPGKYKVKLTVTNTINSSVLEKLNYIEVKPSLGLTTQYNQTFETDIPSALNIQDIFIEGSKWQKRTSLGYNSTSCIQAMINENTPNGEIFSFGLPEINLKKQKGLSPFLSFNCAYTQHTTNTVFEEMRILVSTDCGLTYTQIWRRLGSSLAYAIGAPKETNFAPDNINKWRTFTNISLANYDSAESVKIRFDVISRSGNSVYLDNINVGTWSASNKNATLPIFSIFPNPTNTNFTINIADNVGPIKKIELYDLVGKLVYQKTFLTNNVKSETISVQNLPNAIYVCKVFTQTENSSALVKVYK